MKKFICCLAVLGPLVFSCVKTDQETEVKKSLANQAAASPVANCDTTEMKYAANIQPLLQQACYKCHGGNGTAAAGVSLTAYADVIQWVYNGKLMGTITHSPGYDAMPARGAQLDPCTISKIQAWINLGTPND